jgi:hypothetical protein
MRQLLTWFGAPDDVVTKLSIEAMRIERDIKELVAVSLPVFAEKQLPDNSQPINVNVDVNEYTSQAIEYIYSRGLTLDSYDFYWSPEYKDRLIIPFRYNGNLVGYTMRKLGEGKPKYISEQTPGYVFNLDNQQIHSDQKIVIVVEGPIDAVSIGGVAILGADIMDKQAMLINRLGMKVILLPDRDKDGLRTIDQAIELGWSVSFPAWTQDIKDANDALVKYGKLWTLRSICDAVEDNPLKIKLRTKQWVS